MCGPGKQKLEKEGQWPNGQISLRTDYYFWGSKSILLMNILRWRIWNATTKSKLTQVGFHVVREFLWYFHLSLPPSPLSLQFSSRDQSAPAQHFTEMPVEVWDEWDLSLWGQSNGIGSEPAEEQQWRAGKVLRAEDGPHASESTSPLHDGIPLMRSERILNFSSLRQEVTSPIKDVADKWQCFGIG